jgi:cysteinyl-tRNA synthetase
MYLCGLTVQSVPHIGHLRGALNYDVLRRWLLRSGLSVTFVRNVTDIDDKILVRSLEDGRPFWAIAYANERVLTADYAALGVLPPTYEPRATGHIPEIQELIRRLIDKGHAYPSSDGSGDVYFDVRSFSGYGALSGRHPDEMESATDGAERGKRDPLDFAVWKGAKPGEPAGASWPSPWGPGRPGWHIECSAMSWRYLGDEFDIHGGGADIAFPHHENEIAQSRGAGLGFARYWVHNALLNLGATKMSKSLGNVITLSSLVAAGIRPVEVRYYLVASHYRSIIDYSEAALREAAAAYRRIEGFVRRATELVGSARDTPVERTPLPEAFTAAMDDDLNTSRALAVIHEMVRDGNANLSTGGDVSAALATVRAMLDVLGLDPLATQWVGTGAGAGEVAELREVVDSLVALALRQRTAARARKEWAAADVIRDELRNSGVLVEDTPAGPRWTLRSESDGSRPTTNLEGDA